MSTNTIPALACDALSVTVAGRKLVDDLNLQVDAGDFVAVLGRNGAGKSLALHTLAGLRPATSGRTLLNGQPVDRDRHFVARHLALLPQYTEDIFPSTVLDTAMIGRHPHLSGLQWESADDRQIVFDALQKMDLGCMAGRDVSSLSGGERRRLAIAQVIAQTPQVYLLDEPTNHLDPQHQIDVMQAFSQFARAGAAIIASLHDVNLASRFADRCLLLFGDGRWELDRTATVLTEDRLSELYQTTIEAVAWRDQSLYVATAIRPE